MGEVPDTTLSTKSQTNGRRKQAHLRIVLNEDVEFKGLSTGLEEYQFIHQALPEIDLDRVDLSTSLFGKRLNAPLVISAMVGGIEPAGRLNRNLAQAAQALGLAMGVGSQRCAIDDDSTAVTYQVRRVIIVDGQGNRNRFDFENPKVNETVPAERFKFVPPPGTSVVHP